MAGSDSTRPTAIPHAGPSLRNVVPTRRQGATTHGIDLRTAFIFLHVDGEATAGDIARTADIPFDQVAIALTELAELGAVDLVDDRRHSGIRSNSFAVHRARVR